MDKSRYILKKLASINNIFDMFYMPNVMFEHYYPVLHLESGNTEEFFRTKKSQNLRNF